MERQTCDHNIVFLARMAEVCPSAYTWLFILCKRALSAPKKRQMARFGGKNEILSIFYPLGRLNRRFLARMADMCANTCFWLFISCKWVSSAPKKGRMTRFDGKNEILSIFYPLGMFSDHFSSRIHEKTAMILISQQSRGALHRKPEISLWHQFSCHPPHT